MQRLLYPAWLSTQIWPSACNGIRTFLSSVFCRLKKKQKQKAKKQKTTKGPGLFRRPACQKFLLLTLVRLTRSPVCQTLLLCGIVVAVVVCGSREGPIIIVHHHMQVATSLILNIFVGIS